MGDPIEHSLSPELFRVLSDFTHVPVMYNKMRVPKDRLKETVSIIKTLNLLRGWNVTLPHKKRVTELLDSLSPEAQAMGAVNVVTISHGKLHGENTDVVGVLETLREQKVKLKKKTAVIFGAGGGALSVAYALGKMGTPQVWILNRSLVRAKSLVSKIQNQFSDTEFIPASLRSKIPPFKSASLYVNTTPLGMMGFPNESLLPSSLNSEALAFDLVYRPEKTLFLDQAARQGLRTVGGLDMLIWQAIAAWEIWVGKMNRKNEIKEKAKRVLRSILNRGRS
jgi:shikimate dehydrogenase